MKKIEVTWIDAGREPTQPPDPRYPKGIALDLTSDATCMRSCIVALPYPAKRCGVHHVHCKRCGLTVAITAAGRVDDPYSARLPCKQPLN